MLKTQELMTLPKRSYVYAITKKILCICHRYRSEANESYPKHNRNTWGGKHHLFLVYKKIKEVYTFSIKERTS